MNPFKSFQPAKKKAIGGISKEEPQTTEAVKPKISALKALLWTLDDDPLNPAVTVDLNATVANPHNFNKKAVGPVRNCLIREVSRIPDSNVLYRQINIEANFDLTPILQSNKLLVAPEQWVDPVTSHIYPFNARLNDRYELADFISQNIAKPRHWIAQECDLPMVILGTQSNSSAGATGGGATLMLGSTSAAAPVNGNVEFDTAMSALQSRLLKWQNALHHLLNNLLAMQTTQCMAVQEATKVAFFVLGRSLSVPEQTSNSAARNSGNTMAMPYTSAIFYKTSSTFQESTENNNTSTQSNEREEKEDMKVVDVKGVEEEPVCLLVGVHKNMLARLQQLGAQCYLVEDPTKPWTNGNSSNNIGHNININKTNDVGGSSKNIATASGIRSGNGSNAEISLSAATRGALDPHASTSALLNSKKLGVNVRLRGRYAVSIVAQVLLETVFSFVREAGRGVSNDVPILLSKESFPHSNPLRWDKRPVQCQHQFTSDSNKQGTGEKAATDPSAQSVHKVQIQGIVSSSSVRALLNALRNMASQVTSGSTDKCSRRNRSVRGANLAAYRFLQVQNQAEAAENNSKSVSAAHLTSLPFKPLLVAGSLTTAAATAPAPLNPMTLTTSASRRYDDGDTPSPSPSGEIDTESHAAATTAAIDGRTAGEAGSKQSSATAGFAATGTISKSTITDKARSTGTELASLEEEGSTTLQKRKLADLSDDTTNTAVAAEPSHLSTEDWLLARRKTDTPYCLMQLTLLTPRMAQAAYAQGSDMTQRGRGNKTSSTGSGTDRAKESPVNDANLSNNECNLHADEWLEELRWCSSKGGVDMKHLVEVVSTTQPTLRARFLPPPVPSTRSHDGWGNGDSFEHLDELDEDGTIVLDALNKYSIYVDNKAM